MDSDDSDEGAYFRDVSDLKMDSDDSDEGPYFRDVGNLEVASDASDHQVASDAGDLASDGDGLHVASDGDGLKVASDAGELMGSDSDWGATSSLPACILLYPVSYIDEDLNCENATTAEAWTTSWREDGVKVSFFVANPPYPSHFSVHVPSQMKNPHLLCGRPRILYSVRNFALISITFGGYRSEIEYYLYRVVGRGRRPSLVHLEYISKQLRKVFHVVSVGILPRGDGDGGFVLAALTLQEAMGQYAMHVFRFERGTWTSKVHVLEGHQIGNVKLYNIEKVIALADGELGFVDLWHGILAFDVLQENLIHRCIPLPKLLPNNHSDEDQLGLHAKYFRDVTFTTDGIIKCVELERCWKHIVREKPRSSYSQGIYTESPKDVWESEMLYDADLMHNEIVNNGNDEVEEIYEYVGWRSISWGRKPDSVCWQKDYSFHAKDIINTTESISTLRKELNGLFVSFPTLSMDGNELYMVAKVDTADHESRVIVVDLGKNSLKKFSLPTERTYLFQEAYVVCDLFNYMNMPSDEFETSWDDARLSVSSTPEANEESGAIMLIRPSNYYPPTQYYTWSTVPCDTCCFSMIPVLEQETILQSVEEPCKGAPVGLQLILFEAARPWQSVEKPICGDFVNGSETTTETVFTPCLEGMKNLKNENGVILTTPFLEICKQILPVLDKFGAPMATQKSVIGDCITVLETKYSSYPSKYEHLYSMVLEEVQNETTAGLASCTFGLVWLTRAMELTVEVLRKTLNCHGWPASSSFKVATELAPNKDKFMDISSGTGKTDIEKFCRTFSPFLKENHDFLARVCQRKGGYASTVVKAGTVCGSTVTPAGSQ